MKLEECLRDIETGMAGQEHADWLRGFCDWIGDTLDKALDRVWLRDEQIAAVCDERDELQAKLYASQDRADEERILRERYYAQRNYAQELADQIADWATLWKRAAKKWYSLATIRAEYGAENSHIADEFLAQRKEARDLAIRMKHERDALQEERNEQERLREIKYHRNKELLTEVQELRKEIEALKERRCETCRHWRDSQWANGLGECFSQSNPHRNCIAQGYTYWEADDD